MTTLQIKNKLIRSIKLVENPKVLEDLYRLLQIELVDVEKLKTPPHVKKAFNKGMKDISEGRYLTDEQAKVEMDKWLRK